MEACRTTPLGSLPRSAPRRSLGVRVKRRAPGNPRAPRSRRARHGAITTRSSAANRRVLRRVLPCWRRCSHTGGHRQTLQLAREARRPRRAARASGAARRSAARSAARARRPLRGGAAGFPRAPWTPWTRCSQRTGRASWMSILPMSGRLRWTSILPLHGRLAPPSSMTSVSTRSRAPPRPTAPTVTLSFASRTPISMRGLVRGATSEWPRIRSPKRRIPRST
mmetsp:Transcript_19705/g.59672  ORF Transcript_19705/g.59672 Transcript_19705/m.59672 type:complete len:223 (-) Transcript_19705:418-1086(-)